MEFETDWKAGSTMAWVERGTNPSHPDQVVLESDPYRRLSYTWHTFTPEWAKTVSVSEEVLTNWPPSRGRR
ncbi:SRPBCC domain-containing protein [Streptomyces sp. NPDC002573]|uniref:SRPBCC domain-containing protein n=1 Tax=Streptomyces sp. NPDC002573 TaxID=3364651 RepID=UPI0036A5D9B7